MEGNLASTVKRIGVVLEMIKFQHSVFALPFALSAMLVAARGLPSFGTFFWIVAACVFARSSAMAFNRWTDVEFDRQNPRTRARALVTGAVSARFALAFTSAAAVGFVFSAAMLNALCFWLSPVALAVLLGYSYVKRFSDVTHFVLGVALGLAPMGAWIAVRGSLEGIALPAILGLSVAVWTAGFDIIYACQDEKVDREAGLRSLPRTLGINGALWVSCAAHGIAFLGFLGFWYAAGLGWGTGAAVAATGAVLAVEHWIIHPYNPSRVETAFFTLNGAVSFVFLIGIATDICIAGI